MQRVLVWGGGAVGGTLAAYWARAGLPVTLVDVVADHVAACRTDGLEISGPVETFRHVVPALTPEEVDGVWPVAVLAVKSQATAQAVAQLAPFVAEDGFVLSAQNGLNELIIAEALGEHRTMGGFVNFGADWLEPGRILFGNRGTVAVGEIDGTIRDRTAAMHRLLRIFEPDAVLTDNIFGFLWSKLAYGAMLSATALTMDTMSENFADPERAPVFAALGREVIGVALAAGVSPLGFDGFDPSAFVPGAPPEAIRRCLADLAAFTRQTGKTRSGVWRDLAVRKRRTEVETQLAPVVSTARRLGLETPALTGLIGLIKEVEEGHRVLGRETFRELIERCSSASMAG